MWIINDATAIISGTIVAFNNARAIECPGGGSATLDCCDVFGNWTDYTDCFEGQLGLNGNISEDPFFCSAETRNYGLAANSPCAPGSDPNPECSLIGAWEVACAPAVTGACCMFPGDCSVMTESTCLQSGGEWAGQSSVCDPNPCPQLGACCFEMICIVLEETECVANGGRFKGRGISCNPIPCQIIGACCFTEICIVLDEADCNDNGGLFVGDETVCDPNPCIPSNAPDPGEAQSRMFLGQARPNPASDRVSLTLNLESLTRIKARVYTVTGKLIERIADRDYAPGLHELRWEIDRSKSRVESGVYYFVVRIGTERYQRRVVVAG